MRQLLSRARVIEEPAVGAGVIPTPAPSVPTELPDFAVAIDGSTHEAPVRIGYPGAAVGYFTVASVLLNLKEMDRLDAMRPVDPQLFRKTEEAATIDAALPGANVVIRTHTSARDSFREALFEVFQDIVVDEEDHKPLAETYEALLALKPTSRPPACPYQNGGCTQYFTPPPGLTTCPCAERRPVYCTDALRIHERFQDGGSNGEAFGEVRQVWELVLMIHLLRCFERKGWLEKMDRLVFLLDGPLAVFGHPAWISAAISRELKRLNKAFRKASGKDLLVLGIEKTGTFSDHFEQLDRTDTGEPRFGPRTYLLPTDQYIKERVIFSVSDKRYGEDTYFGRKLLYKTKSGARIVANMAFLSDEQDTLSSDDISLYSQFPTICALLDKLVSVRYPNALAPIVAAHAQAAIPLHLGAKVLQQLARALMRSES